MVTKPHGATDKPRLIFDGEDFFLTGGSLPEECAADDMQCEAVKSAFEVSGRDRHISFEDLKSLEGPNHPLRGLIRESLLEAHRDGRLSEKLVEVAKGSDIGPLFIEFLPIGFLPKVYAATGDEGLKDRILDSIAEGSRPESDRFELPDIIPFLRGVVEEGNPARREKAVRLLLSTGDPWLVKHYEGYFERFAILSPFDAEVLSLLALKNDRAFKVLTSAFRSVDQPTREAAMEGLLRLPNPEVHALTFECLFKLPEDHRLYKLAEERLNNLLKEGAIEPEAVGMYVTVTYLNESTDFAVRFSAAEFLADKGLITDENREAIISVYELGFNNADDEETVVSCLGLATRSGLTDAEFAYTVYVHARDYFKEPAPYTSEERDSFLAAAFPLLVRHCAEQPEVEAFLGNLEVSDHLTERERTALLHARQPSGQATDTAAAATTTAAAAAATDDTSEEEITERILTNWRDIEAFDPPIRKLVRGLGNANGIVWRGETDRDGDGRLDCGAVGRDIDPQGYRILQSALKEAGLIDRERELVCNAGHRADVEVVLEETEAALESGPPPFTPAEMTDLINIFAPALAGYRVVVKGSDEARFHNRLAEVIRRLGGINYFIRLYKRQDRSDYAMTVLMRLTRKGDRKLIPFYEAVILDRGSTPERRMAAYAGLVKVGRHAEGTLRTLLARDSFSSDVISALGEAGTTACLKDLDQLLGETPDHRVEIASTYRKILEREGMRYRVAMSSSPYTYFLDRNDGQQYSIRHDDGFAYVVKANGSTHRTNDINTDNIAAAIEEMPDGTYVLTIYDKGLAARLNSKPLPGMEHGLKIAAIPWPGHHIRQTPQRPDQAIPLVIGGR